MYPGTWARTDPGKPAVIMADSGRTTTYAKLDERSLRMAHALADAGLRPGDVVAMVCDNQPEAFEVYWAALRSGLYVTAVNNDLPRTPTGKLVKAELRERYAGATR